MGWENCPGDGNGNQGLQYSYLESPMDSGAWRTTVHRVAKSQTCEEYMQMRRVQLSMHTRIEFKHSCFVSFVASDPLSLLLLQVFSFVT